MMAIENHDADNRPMSVYIAMPRDLVRRLDRASADERRSRTAQIRVLVERWLAERQLSAPPSS